MTVLKEASIERYIGLSTDTKPTGVRIGSTFLEYDTGALYVTYDGTNWTPKIMAGEDWVSVVAKLFEWTSSSWIATQALTADGIQWSDEETLAVGESETQVFGAIFEPPKAGTLIAVELGLVCQLKSGEATAAKKWRWKARNKDGTWVNLHGEVEENLTTAYVEKTRSGNFYAVTNFNEVPFEVGLFCTPHASTADATIISQIKNASQATIIYKPS